MLRNRGYTMKIALKWFSIHKLQCIKRMKEWAQWTSEFFMHFSKWIKNCSSAFHGIMFLFHTYWNLHCEVGWLTEIHCLSIRGTNNSTSQYKCQYVWNEVYSLISLLVEKSQSVNSFILYMGGYCWLLTFIVDCKYKERCKDPFIDEKYLSK